MLQTQTQTLSKIRPWSDYKTPPPQTTILPAVPTPAAREWLAKLARSRATGDKILAIIWHGTWLEIDAVSADGYHVRQLPLSSDNGLRLPPPVFVSPFTGQRDHYSAVLTPEQLRAGISCAFVFDPQEVVS